MFEWQNNILQTLSFLVCMAILFSCNSSQKNNQQSKAEKYEDTLKISKKELMNKIKGAWAGKTIGVTYGAPYEFEFKGTFIQDFQPLEWSGDQLKNSMIKMPHIYDDVYVGLSFLDVIDKYGYSAPSDSFASAIARADYDLWHANQVVRYNYLNGLKPPHTGHWINNPHADDIDFQIDADFIGIVSPVMPKSAGALADSVGHILSYGDGWYGGVFVASLYSFSFGSDDIERNILDALTMIPKKSRFHKCIKDAINWFHEYPDDWHSCWFQLQKKWSFDIACTKGVFDPYDIDAKINSAYVVLALLYGQGDFSKSLEIAIRCGQDADCNPATVGGVLGTILGYERIPVYWKSGLKGIEGIRFQSSKYDLNKAYKVSWENCLKLIQLNKGRIYEDIVSIPKQKPAPVPYEESFKGMKPVKKISLNHEISDTLEFEFTGNGFSLSGFTQSEEAQSDFKFEIKILIDNEASVTEFLPVDFKLRKYDIYSNFQLEEADHAVKIILINPNSTHSLNVKDLIIYNRI